MGHEARAGVAADAGHVDDPTGPPLPHDREHPLRQVEHPGQLTGDLHRERVPAHLVERLERRVRRVGVADQDVHPAVLATDLLDELADLVPVPDVGLDRLGAAA
jgi:hypothetical protein